LATLSIVIPAYNEERRLPGTLTAIQQYLQNSPWPGAEIVVVDDGSRDGTAQIARKLSEANPSIRVLENSGNRGKGYSVRRGMLEARREWILFSDADLSTPIEELEKLRQAVLAKDAAIAIGSRALDRSLIEVHQSVLRENAGRVFNLVMRVLTGLPFWDTQCGFKLFRRDAAQQVFRRQTIERFGFDAEVLYVAKKLGYKTVEVPVRWAHAEGTKVSMFRDSLDMMLDLFLIRSNDLRGRYR
jgi:dolichyl-phosphate beta-glucosyltransferase